MFSKYYSQVFLPFLNKIFKPNTGYYYLLALIIVPILSYWNLLTNSQYPLPINLILVSIVIMLFTYAFTISMFLQNEDNHFESLQTQPNIFTLNFFSVLFVIIYFMSYFIGLLLIKNAILGNHTLPCTFLFSISSLFFGMSIANYSFYKYHNEKSNKDTIISFVLIALLSGLYFAMYYFIPINVLIFSIIVLIVLSVLFYFYSVKLINKKSYVK